MDIVDAQYHFGPGGMEQALAKMDALGIAGVVIDEFWTGEWNGYPAYKLPSGVFRTTQPTAELAATVHPARFTSLLRVERNDPEVRHIIRLAGQAPHVRAIRIHPGMDQGENKAFGEGKFADIFAAACDAGMPLFVFAPLHLDALTRYARDFPSLKICVDHCGLFANVMRYFIPWVSGPPVSFEQQLREFDKVLALSDLPNVGLKWAHASQVFERPIYPGEELRPMLRRALDAFGPDRIMWAADASMNQEPWAENLFSMRINPDLSSVELAALMGGTARKWLNWSKEAPPRELPIQPPTPR